MPAISTDLALVFCRRGPPLACSMKYGDLVCFHIKMFQANSPSLPKEQAVLTVVCGLSEQRMYETLTVCQVIKDI